MGSLAVTAQAMRQALLEGRAVLRDLGPQIQCLESWATDDRIYCVYISSDEATIREHTQRGEFPGSRDAPVKSVIDPTPAET